MWKHGLLVFGIVLCVHGNIRWECDNFPDSEPVDGCDWQRSDFHWEEQNAEGVPDPAGREGNALRIFYPNGSWVRNDDNKGGFQFYAYPFEPADALTLEYEVYFSENFDFVMGGKLPGFFGGTGSCAGGQHNLTCFSTRYMWRDYGDGEIYGYIPNDTQDWYCDLPDVVCDYTYGHSFGRGRWRFVQGRWYTIAQDVKLNDPGEFNGSMRVRLNGEEVYEISDLNFRNDETIQISRIYFSTFFGGSTIIWASTGDVYSYFRNFKVMDYVE